MALALAGLRVLCTGLEDDTAVCQQLVQELGGELLSRFSSERTPQVLIAKDVTTEKYRATVNAVAKVPVVLPEWLKACKKAGRQVPFDGYRVGCFAGLKVTVTGMTIPERSALREAVTKGGGVFVPMLTKDCTELVCISPCDPGSKKYKMAITWKVPTVNKQWVLDSTNQLAMQDEKRYPVVLAVPQSTGTGATGLPKQQTSRSAGTPQPSAADNPAPSAIEDANLIRPGTTGARGKGDPLCLDGVRFVLCSCSTAETAEQAKLGREAGAIRVPDLTHSVTHVVVGSGQDTAALSALREHLRRYSEHVVLVNTEWLRQCAAICMKLDADNSYAVPLSRLQPSKLQAAGNEHTGRGREPVHASNSSHSWQHAASQSQSMHAHVPRKPVTTVGILEGLSFTLAALEGNEALIDKATKFIQAGGGEILAPNFRVPPELKVYAVCPFGFPKDYQVMIEQRSSVFRKVAEKRRVTVHWLEIVCRKQELYSIEVSTAFKPLPHKLPMDCMADVKVCVSGYEDDQRYIIKLITKELGGKFTQSMGRSNTHLVLPAATGEKYRHTGTMGVIPVTVDWLLASAAKGMKLGESRYAPKPAPDGQAEVQVEDASLGADSAIPSQVCTTQYQPPPRAHRPPTQTRMGKGACALNLSQSSHGAGNPAFLDRLMQSHKVDQSEVAHRPKPDGGNVINPCTSQKQQAAARPKTCLEGIIADLCVEPAAEGDSSTPRAEEPSAQAAPAAEKNAAEHKAMQDLDAEMLAKMSNVMSGLKDSSPPELSQALPFCVADVGGSGNMSHPSASGGRSTAGGSDGLSRRTKRKAAQAEALRSRSRRVRGMPPPQDASRSNDGDFIASQMDNDMQVVYQESEKTAVALQRVGNKRPKTSKSVSAKEFLNRAVLSGIDNNTGGKGGDDELVAMGLL